MSQFAKRLLGVLSFVRIALLSITCLCSMGAANGAYAVPYQLIVNGGSGGGFYEPSSIVHISAFPYDANDPATSTAEPGDAKAPLRIFARWSGDTATVNDIKARETTLVMPSQNSSVTAQFKDAARWKSPHIITSFPEHPVGVIYVFHGIRGGIAELIASLEMTRFVDQALSRNFAVVMIESYERKKGLWDVDHTAVADNVDMARLVEVHKRLVAKGMILASYPVYFVGISQGGFFATRAAAEADRGALPFTVKAVASYICPGSRAALENTSASTIFMLARNDDVMDNGWALSDFDLLLDRGIATQLWIQEPTPVHPDRFWGIPGLSQTDSQLLQRGLKANGLLDAQNFLLAYALEDGNGDGAADWVAALPTGYTDFLPEIGRQLRAAHSGHTFFSNMNDKTFAFFENPTTIMNLLPVITGVSPASGDVGTAVTLTGNNFVDIQSVTFNGKPSLRFGSTPKILMAIVPVGATTGPIQVTNSAGTAVSLANFTVTGAPGIGDRTPSTVPSIDLPVRTVRQYGLNQKNIKTNP